MFPLKGARRKEMDSLMKGNIYRNNTPLSRRVIAFVALLIWGIPKEYTINSVLSTLTTLFGGKQGGPKA